MPDVKRAKNISLGDVLGKCKRHAFLVSLLNKCLSFYILSVNGYVAAVGLKLEYMRACLSSSKLPQTIEWLINSRCLFLVVLGLGGPRSRCWQSQNLARVHSLLIDKVSSLCVLNRERGQKFSSRPFFIRVLISFIGLHFCDLMNLRELHILMLSLEVVMRS